MAIDLDIVEAEIDRLEAKETTFYVCDRLAMLYTVRDHLKPQAKADSAVIPDMGGSEFLEAVSGMKCRDVMEVIDEHIEVIRTLYPRSYESLMARIRGIR